MMLRGWSRCFGSGERSPTPRCNAPRSYLKKRLSGDTTQPRCREEQPSSTSAELGLATHGKKRLKSNRR